MENTPLDRLHADPGNWKLGFIYFSREDSRLLVPKRIRGLGFTLNFARPLAVPFVLLILGLAAAPLARWIGPQFGPLILVGKLLLILVLLAAARHFSSPARS